MSLGSPKWTPDKPDNCRTIVRHLSGFCPAVVRHLSGSCPACQNLQKPWFSRFFMVLALPDRCRTTLPDNFAGQLSGTCPAFVRQLSGFCPAFVRLLPGNCSVDPWRPSWEPVGTSWVSLEPLLGILGDHLGVPGGPPETLGDLPGIPGDPPGGPWGLPGGPCNP